MAERATNDRHPKVREGVMIGAGAKVGTKYSLVLDDVPAHVTVAGIPAKIVGRPTCQKPCDTMQQNILED